jgi:hypothetical protein
MRNSIMLDEQLTGFKWDNGAYRKSKNPPAKPGGFGELAAQSG